MIPLCISALEEQQRFDLHLLYDLLSAKLWDKCVCVQCFFEMLIQYIAHLIVPSIPLMVTRTLTAVHVAASSINMNKPRGNLSLCPNLSLSSFRHRSPLSLPHRLPHQPGSYTAVTHTFVKLGILVTVSHFSCNAHILPYTGPIPLHTFASGKR